ncbi:MAG TPA: SAM-dependent methyltransferase, partial [Cryptosporangiaceae bacterium]|nr:SAM-dependent methyltransferase [Cryptosporangiaceae bacterium]
GVPVEVVPGVTSAIAAPSAAGIPVTHRGITHEVVFVSGHLAPEDPQSLVDWPALGRLRGTVVLLMAVERLDAIAAALVAHGRPASTPVAVVQEGTMPGQRQVIATLEDVAAVVGQAGLGPPAIVVVGDVVRVGAELAALTAALR